MAGPREARPVEEEKEYYSPPIVFASCLFTLYFVMILILCIHIRIIVRDHWRTLEAQKTARISARNRMLTQRMSALLLMLNLTWLGEAVLASWWGLMALMTGRWWSLGTSACNGVIVTMFMCYIGGFYFLFAFYFTRWRLVRGVESERTSRLGKVARGLVAAFALCQLAIAIFVRGKTVRDGRCHLRRTIAFFVLCTASYVIMLAISTVLLNLFLAPLHQTLQRSSSAQTPRTASDEKLRASMMRCSVAVGITCASTVTFLALVVLESMWSRATNFDLRGVTFTSILTPLDILINSSATLYSRQLPFVGSCFGPRLSACARRVSGLARPPSLPSLEIRARSIAAFFPASPEETAGANPMRGSDPRARPAAA